ncbi:MAG: TolC family protein [Alphaproteobacteria bacterium]|nr:TolC family protein [Alphaproteobacteria bacterium]
MFKYKLFFATGLALFAFAPGLGAATLQEMVSATLASHPAVEGAQARLQASVETKKAQVSGYFPEVSVTGTGGRNYADNSTSRGLSVSRGAGYSWLWEGSVTARQKIFDGMQTQNRVAASRADVKAAELGVVDVRESLAMRAVQTYIDLGRVRAGLALLQEQEKNIQNYLSRIENMVHEGAADETELQQAKDVLAILDNYKNDYEGQINILEADFFELAGYGPEGALNTVAPHPDFIPDSVEEATKLAVESHPLMRSALYDVRSARRSADVEKGALYPEVDGEVSYLKVDKEDLIGGEAVDARAVLRMNWNLETGGGQLARIREKNQRYKELQSHARELERTVSRTVRQAYAEYETATNQVEIQDRRVALNSKLFDTYKSQFEGARISLLQLMQSENQLLIARLEKMNAQSRVLLAQYSILAAMGRLQDSLNVVTAAVSDTGADTQ